MSITTTPAAALVKALRGRTVIDAYCDGEGMDDVHLLLDDGTAVWVDADVDPNVAVEVPGGERLELGPRGRLVVSIGRRGPQGTELPFGLGVEAADPGHLFGSA